MSDSLAPNFSSLKMIHPELVVTLEQASAELEQFIANRNDLMSFRACIDSIAQIAGTLELIQVQGATELASEIVELAENVDPEQEALADEQLGLIARAFLLLPRYLEYLLQTQRDLPVLLIPQINEVRLARKQTLLADSHYTRPNFDTPLAPAKSVKLVDGEDMAALIKRLRHMYQVGLLGILKNKQIKPSLNMMQRSLQRMSIIQADTPFYSLWSLGSAALQHLSRSMELTASRKKMLGALDRELKYAIKRTSVNDPAAVPSQTLCSDLLFISALSGDSSEKTTLLLAQYGLTLFPYTDAELRRERDVLNGPNANTLQSMASVLNGELVHAKDILERASQGGISSGDDLVDLIDTLKKVAEILGVVGLVVPGNSLKNEILTVESWQRAGKLGDDTAQLHLADILLYIESAIGGVGSSGLSDDSIARVNSQERQEVIARSQLTNARYIVLNEAEAGLALVKRSLSSFTESNYDRGHINNVTVSLNAIRGVLAMLTLSRAESVMQVCIDFVEDVLMDSNEQADLEPLMETFADAVVSMEYYLDAIKSDENADDKVLEIAEESLAALGYSLNRA
ncbi:MAG TPA: pilus assembly protein [Porticoccus sp.]|nr:pilus assembly protein [Porticoccus sp.]